MEKVGNLVKGGAIPKPVWFEAMQQCPPPTLPFRHGCPAAAAALHAGGCFALLADVRLVSAARRGPRR